MVMAYNSKRVDPFYLTKEWDALRRACLQRDGYKCQHCQAKVIGKKRGGSTPHVDHIKPRKSGGTDTLDNLRTLCASCHSKTSLYARQDKPSIGADGYPMG